MALAQQESDELSPEEFDAGLIAPQAELTPEAFDAGLGIKPQKKPKEAGPLRALAGSALESLSSVPGLFSIVGERAAAGADEFHQALTGQERAPLQESPMRVVERGIKGTAEEVYPPEQRGQGGFLSEDLPAGVGSMLGAMPAMAIGPGAAALQFGAQNGVPLYYDVKEATGDEEAAMWGLLFGGAVGQLEKFGAEKALGGVIKKLAVPKVATAIERAAMVAATAGQEAGTEFAQQALTDTLYENLTDEDVAVLENALSTLPVSLTLGGFAGGIRAAMARRPSQGIEPAKAPGKPQETGTPEATLEPIQAEVAPQAQPGGEAESPVVPIAGVPASSLGPSAEGSVPAYQAITPSDSEASVPQKSVGAASGVDLPPKEPDVEVQEEPEATGIKNAVVERELEKMGLPLPEKAERKGFVELHAKAKAAVEEDPEAGRKLVADLEGKPRPISDEEDAILTFEANKLIKEREAAEKAYIEDPSEANQKRIEAASEAYQRAANAMDRAGTEQGRALNARKMMLARDYSLAEMERKLVIAKKGQKLTEPESVKLRELHKKIAATQKALDEHISQAKVKQAELEARALLAEAKAFAAKESRAQGHKARRASIKQTKKEIDEILTKLARGQKAAAGLDPEKVVLTAQLAGKYVKLGYQSFDLFAREVVGKLGEGIRPYLKTAWDEAQKASDEELLTRYKARKQGDIQRMKEKKEILPLEVKRRKTPVEKDKRATELRVEYEAAKTAFEQERERVRLANRTKAEKALDLALEPLRATRSIVFSFDLPPVFRQAARLAVPDIFLNPKRLATYFAKGVSASRLRNAQRIDVEIRNSDLYPLMQAGKLDLPSVEEDMNSWLARKIPGIGASSRMYNTFMNLYRANAFERMVRAMPNPTIEEVKAAASAVNTLSGRTPASGKFASAMDALSPVLSSPKLLLSNIKYALGTPLMGKMSMRMRTRILRDAYVRPLVGYAALYGLVQAIDELDGDDELSVSWDPRSSDFGKIVVGEKRFDVMGGLSQVITLGGRLATGETKDLSGKVKAIRGPERPFKGKDAIDVGKDFLRWKLSPAAEAVTSIVTGEQRERGPGGKPIPTTPESLIEGMFLPITFQDILEDMKKQGVEETLALRIISLVGIGAQDYGEGKR